MNTEEHITNWLKSYAQEAKKDGFVVGVSGGIDSAVVSTLCANTELSTICMLMPIHQNPDHTKRGKSHIEWLMRTRSNVWLLDLPLTQVYDSFVLALPLGQSDLALANSRARLRMTALYTIATTRNMLVAGTGNKVEDMGVGFYTKWGDGAVDLSPIGSLTKTEVWQLGKDLGVSQEIIDAVPSDGLWDNSRSDADQIGASYQELEQAMALHEQHGTKNLQEALTNGHYQGRLAEVIGIYLDFHLKNRHKMDPIPICPHV